MTVSSALSWPNLWDLRSWFTIVVALLAVWAFYRIKNWRFIQLGDNLPGPPTLPLLGNIPLILRTIAAKSHDGFFQAVWNESRLYHGFARLWLGPRLLVGIWNPEDVEVILSSNVHVKKSIEYKLFQSWIGDGLLISNGEKWKTHRKLIAPTFHLGVLKTFVSLFNVHSISTVERMKREFGKEFDVHDYLVETTVEVLIETVMGVSKKVQKNAHEYGRAVMKMCDITHNRHYKIWLRNDFLFSLTSAAKIQGKLLNTIHSLTRRVLNEKQSQRKSGKESVATSISENDQIESSQKDDETVLFDEKTLIQDDLDEDLGEKKRRPFLDQLIDIGQDGVVLTDAEIEEQVNTIMFEGHDTIASSSSFFMCLMGNNPEHQERCVEELREIFGDSDRHATFQDTLEMKYLERCILETLRMFPAVPVIARELTEDCKMASGDYTIPAGATVAILPYIIHHEEKLYPNHDVFNPDNFLPDRVSSRHYYSYIPFSAGPRSCVGRKFAMIELKILLSTILRNFKISSKIPNEKFQLQADIILKRSDGFKVQIEPRKVITQSTELPNYKNTLC